MPHAQSISLISISGTTSGEALHRVISSSPLLSRPCLAQISSSTHHSRISPPRFFPQCLGPTLSTTRNKRKNYISVHFHIYI
jgi:hypothetical protein